MATAKQISAVGSASGVAGVAAGIALMDTLYARAADVDKLYDSQQQIIKVIQADRIERLEDSISRLEAQISLIESIPASQRTAVHAHMVDSARRERDALVRKLQRIENDG